MIWKVVPSFLTINVICDFTLLDIIFLIPFLSDFKIYSPFSPWYGMTGSGIFSSAPDSDSLVMADSLFMENKCHWCIIPGKQVPLMHYSWKASATDALFMENKCHWCIIHGRYIFVVDIVIAIISAILCFIMFSYICCKMFLLTYFE